MAIRIIMAAVLAAFASAATAADLDAGAAAYHRGDHAAALREFRPLAEQGDAQAQFWLGLMHAFGDGVPLDVAVSAAWYRKAAEQGHPDAQNNLGVMYDEGVGVSEDDREAAAWYRRAAEQGLAYAQSNLGYMYDDGVGVSEDDREAAAWYRRAAEQGLVYAQFRLGVMYDEGEGALPEDDVLAYVWLNLAAAQGDYRAMEIRDRLRSRMTEDDVAEAEELSRELAARISQR